MKIIITESQISKYVFNWLKTKYGNLSPTVIKDDGLKITLFRDENKNVIFYSYKDKGKTYFHINRGFIINHLETFFDMDYTNDIRGMLKNWLEETYLFNNVNTENIYPVPEDSIEKLKI